jgi:hypothetical protein
MTAPKSSPHRRIDALRAVLRLCAGPPRPIPYPETSPHSRFGGQR